MRKITYWVHTSVDGYIAGPNGEFDWPVMGPELSAYSEELLKGVDTFLYGRLVWELMSSYWPTDLVSDHPHDQAFAPIWRSTAKVVVSRTLAGQELGHGARVLAAAEEVAALKSAPGGDILLTGGASLAASLAELGLVDEYHVGVHPIALGGGPAVFPVAERLTMTLAGTRICDERVAVLRFTR
jgi:dihydrofolate reductase